MMAGPIEKAVISDLAEFPEKMRNGGIAMTARLCARALDEGNVTPRDATSLVREIRLALVQLRDMSPGEVKGDTTDELRQRREDRMAGKAEKA